MDKRRAFQTRFHNKTLNYYTGSYSIIFSENNENSNEYTTDDEVEIQNVSQVSLFIMNVA